MASGADHIGDYDRVLVCEALARQGHAGLCIQCWTQHCMPSCTQHCMTSTTRRDGARCARRCPPRLIWLRCFGRCHCMIITATCIQPTQTLNEWPASMDARSVRLRRTFPCHDTRVCVCVTQRTLMQVRLGRLLVVPVHSWHHSVSSRVHMQACMCQEGAWVFACVFASGMAIDATAYSCALHQVPQAWRVRTGTSLLGCSCIGTVIVL
jgi:hypothetical protein